MTTSPIIASLEARVVDALQPGPGSVWHLVRLERHGAFGTAGYAHHATAEVPEASVHYGLAKHRYAHVAMRIAAPIAAHAAAEFLADLDEIVAIARGVEAVLAAAVPDAR